jgi:hypothetical protein
MACQCCGEDLSPGNPKDGTIKKGYEYPVGGSGKLATNAATNTIRNLYHKDLDQQKWPTAIFTGRGAQGNHIGHKRFFVKALIHEKIHANTLQIPYLLQRCRHPTRHLQMY